MPEAKVPTFHVEKIRAINKGNLLGFASVRVGQLIINDCRVVQQPGQDAWVSLPQNSYVNKDGETKYAPIVECPKEWKEAIQEAVLTAWENQT